MMLMQKWQICLEEAEKPVILVVNKVDNYNKMMADVFEFYNLGIGEPIAISAAQRSGLGDMLDKVTEHFASLKLEAGDDDQTSNCHSGKTKCRKVLYYQQTYRRKQGNCF